jgi:S-disulfanyl-L-cysteine oxidoreductase SoxD
MKETCGMSENPCRTWSASTVALVSLAALFAGDAAAAKDGFFTIDQATQGHQLFNNYCAECHRPDLTGSDSAPPLVGKKFRSAWGTQKVSDLISFEHQNMPANNPGGVPNAELYPITAYILQKNGFPAGPTALSAATAKRPIKK